MIDLERVEQALNFLAQSDLAYAEAKTEVERATHLAKHARALVYPQTDGTVDERKAAVERSAEVTQAEDRRLDAIMKFESLKAKRERAGLTIDLFRTLEASRRLGG